MQNDIERDKKYIMFIHYMTGANTKEKIVNYKKELFTAIK